jgi:rhodanese-related sulfurtransferase
MFKQIDPAELSRIQETGPVLLLDVRTDAEFARGYIAGAQHIPLHLLPVRSGELKPDVPTVVYCQSGGRSAQACAWLAEQGFAEVANLQGGIGAWLREGRPVVVPG